MDKKNVRCPNCGYKGENPHNPLKILFFSVVSLTSLVLLVVSIATGYWYKADTGFALIITFVGLPVIFGSSVSLLKSWSVCPKCGFKNIVNE